MSNAARAVAGAGALLAVATFLGACGGGTLAARATPTGLKTPTAAAASTAAAPRGQRGSGSAARVPKPPIHHLWIPLTPRRLRETSAYAQRHYGLRGWTIAHPRAIVEHLTENDSIAATFNTFAPDVPDVELHELPGICSQFAIGR